MDSKVFKKVSLPFKFYIPLAVCLSFFSSYTSDVGLQQIVVTFLLGGFTWTFVEYIAHRFPLHVDPKKGFCGLNSSESHWFHHEQPEDRVNIVLPISFSFSIVVILYILGALFYWDLYLTSIWMSGMILGYLYYEIVHLSVHNKGYKWKGPKSLRQHHLIHHFKDDTKNFGVTCTFWDYVFRTKMKP